MKAFDLEKAKNGEPVFTRSGKKVEIIRFDEVLIDGSSIVALVDSGNCKQLASYNNQGHYCTVESGFDLFMEG